MGCNYYPLCMYVCSRNETVRKEKKHNSTNISKNDEILAVPKKKFFFTFLLFFVNWIIGTENKTNKGNGVIVLILKWCYKKSK